MPRERARHPFFWVAVGLGALVVAAYAFAGWLFARYGGEVVKLGWSYALRGDRWYVSGVETGGPAEGKLRPGDRIEAIDDDTRVRGAVRWTGPVWLRVRRLEAGQAYTVRVARDAAEIEVSLAPAQRPISEFLGPSLSLFAVSLSFFLAGLLIGLLKPEDPAARLGASASLATALVQLMNVLGPVSGPLLGGELAAYFAITAANPWHHALAYHFTYRFPAGAPPGRLWAWLLYVLYAWVLAVFLVYRFANGLVLGDEGEAARAFAEHSDLFAATSVAYDALVAFGVVAMCVVIAHNYRRVKQPAERRRIKWIVYGLVLGAAPWVVLSLTRVALGPGWPVPGEAFFLANLTLAVIPVTTGYAILKHRAFDIPVVLRRGVKYLLARGFLQAVLLVQVAAVAYLLFTGRDRPLAEILSHNSAYLYLLGTTALTLAFRRRLGAWIDRRFFREAYDQERILVGLVDAVKKLESMSDISRLVSREVDAALHPKSVFVFYRHPEKPGLTLGHSTQELAEELRMREDVGLLRLLEGRGAEGWPSPALQEAVPEAERAWLDRLGIQLVVPIAGADEHVLGLMLLGERKSEEPYSHTDRRLLEAIAAQMGVLYENALLRSSVERERRIRRDVLERIEGRVNLVKECPTCGLCFDAAEPACPRDGTPLVLSLPVDRTVEGKYRLERLLGKGGMGAVYEATDVRLDRRVAVKIMLGSRFGDPDALRRFEREARAAARLSHQNIITVYDYGTTGADGAFLVMEMVQGTSLRAELTRAGALAPATAAPWFAQILEGVGAAHDAGVVHRDLKPENVLLARDDKGGPLVKILDFGVAKLGPMAARGAEGLTVPGTLLGTMGYMPPEQLTGEDVDPRADLFSVGVMVVEAVTGRRPFAGATLPELVAAMYGRPYRLPGEGPAVGHLDEVLQRCLATDRTRRFASAAELGAALVPALLACPPVPLQVKTRGAQSDAETMALDSPEAEPQK
jgi:hypothetical protein